MDLQRLGVLGGTFDPIHEGHLSLAREAKRQAGLDGVVLAPMARPAHREAEAAPEQRLRMCQLALEGENGIFLSRAGLESGVRYTADTLAILRRPCISARRTASCRTPRVCRKRLGFIMPRS